MALGMVLSPMALRAEEAVRPAAPPAAAPGPIVTGYTPPVAECIDPIVQARPLWPELATPGGSGYPDYIDVSENLQVVKSLRLLASIFTRAGQKLEDFTSEEDDEAEGRCLCSLTSVPWKTKKKDCTLANNTCSPAPSGGYPLWFPSDIYRKPSGVFRFVLRQVDFLDKLFSRMGKVAAALQAIGSDIKETAAYLEAFGDHVDRFSDGYHLGGYSTERPALHLCVGYAGHGAFAEMANLFGEVSIGGRYASHNLSKEHRAQFRAGGFGVTAFGRSISIMPGIEAGLQIDGFKMWDAQRPFGIDFPSVGVCPPTDCAECGFPLNRFEDYDIFHLIDTEAELRPLDKSLDGCLQLGEFVVVDRYKARYLSATDGGTYFWPRGPLPSDWEKNNTAVFAAGLNLPLELEQVVKCIPPGIPPNLCPGPGIDLFPGAKLYLKFTLDAGVEWSHRAYGMRKRLQDQVNKKLPTSLQLDEGDFERTMHDFQAPDCSGDDGTTAFVKPRVAGDLFVGIPLGRYLHAGITATIGTGVRVEPGAYGGVVDLNVALADTLRLSNPPREAPCDPVISTDPTTACSNTYFIDSTGVAESTGTYSCDVDDVVTFHCKAPEDDRTCTVANAAEDCPTTGICEASYGCTSHGYCTRTLGPGPDGIPGNADDVTEVTHDTTYASCSGFAVCAAEALNAGAPCDEDSACVAAMQCAGGQNAGQPCNSDPECLEGECEMPKVPCLPTPPVGYFTPYHCATHVNPSITGWEGPGCHPLTVGFASACGCTTDADCVSGQETCVDGACAIGGTPVTCSCDTGLPNSCPAGRVCREGGCVLDCTAHGVADCAAYQVCTGGVCLNPYGIRFAEQIVWHMTHTPKPQHAVSTYALSDILVSLILDASLRIALDLRIFNRLRQFELLDLADYWVIDATLETWYQPGLEVRYQNDCDPVAGNWVTNWQPDPADPSEPRLVTRYNPLNATTGTLGNAGKEDDLLAWCGDTLPTDVADPEGATTNGIIEAVTDLVNWGEDIGMDIWSSNSLCVRQSGPGDPVSTPLAQWLADLKAQSATLTCQYTYQGVPYIFPCAELRNQLLWIWGCLDVNANPWGPLLASAFPGYVTQFSGRQVFNLDLMMDDYRNEFSLDHLDPAIRSYSIGLAFVGVFWYAEVAACFETRFAAMQPGELGLAGVTVEPCCGNGSLDQQGCGLGVSALPCELCDDGNRTAGDGCSPVCRLEDSTPAPRCGDGVRHVGLGEECDDGNQVSGDGCEPDCTLPPEPSPCPGAGLCGLVHDTPACADGACCNVVCGLNPACCLVEWSEACVQLAFELCAPCIGECTSNGYGDNPNCCVNPTDCVCYPPEHPVSVMICGPDCNGNGIADATEPDLDGNGIPDDCECVGGLAGDYDFDGDVDFMDYMVLGGCFAGPAGDLAMGCICADSNGDATVDLRDFATFQAAFGL